MTEQTMDFKLTNGAAQLLKAKTRVLDKNRRP